MLQEARPQSSSYWPEEGHTGSFSRALLSLHPQNICEGSRYCLGLSRAGPLAQAQSRYSVSLQE